MAVIHRMPANSSPEHSASTGCWCQPWRFLDNGVPWYQHHDGQPYWPPMWTVLYGD